MSHSRSKQNHSKLAEFKRLFEELIVSMNKPDFNQSVSGFKRLIYFISGRFYCNSQLTQYSVHRIYEALNKFIDLYPDRPQPYLLQAIFFARQHQIELALKAYDAIHLRFPNYKAANYRHKLLLQNLQTKTVTQGHLHIIFSEKDKPIIRDAVLKYIKNDQFYLGDVEFELWKDGGQGDYSRYNLTIDSQTIYYDPRANNSIFKKRLLSAWHDRCSANQGHSITLLNSLIDLINTISLTSDDIMSLFKAVAGFKAIYSNGMKANLLLANLYTKLGFYDEACDIYLMLEMHHPASSEAYRRHETLLRHQGKTDEAKAIIQLKESRFNERQSKVEAQNKQSLMHVKKLLAPIEDHAHPSQCDPLPGYNQYNWQPEIPHTDQKDYSHYKSIKKFFENTHSKAKDHYEKYVHPNARLGAIRNTKEQTRYNASSSYASVAKSKPHSAKRAFKKVGD